MTKLFILSLFILLLCGCRNHRQREVAIWIENNSDMSRNIEVTTYLGDSLIESRDVAKDSIADRILPFKIILQAPADAQKYTFKFVLPAFNEETSCTLDADSLGGNTLLHVNYVERVYKKGRQIENAILTRDSIYGKSFYCEVIYHVRKY